MKILQVTAHFSPNVGGVETHLLDLVEGLEKRKNSVFVLTYRPLVAKSNWKIVEKKKNITILRLPWLPGLFYKFVHSPVIEFLYLTPGLFFALPFVFIIYRPDVVHAHGIVAGFVSAFWSKIFRKKTLVSTHSLYHFPSQGIYYSFAKLIFSNCDIVLCLSDQSVNEIKMLNVPAKKIKRFTYWVDIDRFKPIPKEKARKKLGFPDKFIVFFVGRLIIIKGVPELIEASKYLPQAIILFIAGEGPLQEEVMTEAKNSNGKIRFLGPLANSQLPYYYNAADVVIVPSTHEEGFGRVILESLACGTPVIGAKRGAIPEAMNERVGRLITITPQNIARTIVYFQKQKMVLKKLQENARKFAEEKYSEKNIDDIIRWYKKITN